MTHTLFRELSDEDSNNSSSPLRLFGLVTRKTLVAKRQVLGVAAAWWGEDEGTITTHDYNDRIATAAVVLRDAAAQVAEAKGEISVHDKTAWQSIQVENYSISFKKYAL